MSWDREEDYGMGGVYLDISRIGKKPVVYCLSKQSKRNMKSTSSPTRSFDQSNRSCERG